MTEDAIMGVTTEYGEVELFEDKVVVDKSKQDGMVTNLFQAWTGRKEIPISEITGVAVDNGGGLILVHGYISFYQDGYEMDQDRMFWEAYDKNTIRGVKTAEFEMLKEEVEALRDKSRA